MSPKADNSRARQHVVRLLALVLVAVVGVACGGESGGGSGGDETPLPTRSGLPSPTRTEDLVPTPTGSIEVPTRSEDDTGPIETQTGGVLPTVTDTVTPAPSSGTGESTSPTAAESDDSDGVPAWVWWALGALVLVLAITIPLLTRQRRRRAWHDDLAAAEEDLVWFARVLVPSLRQADSLDQVAGGWAVSSDRVLAVENRLNALAESPPDDEAKARVTRLRDVVHASREQIQQLLTSGTPEAIPRVLSLVSSGLESALAPAPRPTS